MQKYRSSVSMLLSKVFLFFLLLFLIFSAVAFAAPGDGEGGGGGSSVPLRMDWSYPADGENNVSVTPIIQCKFSHNVAHNAVIEKNTALFSLAKLDGTKIDANVYVADIQLEFDKRQYIYMQPVSPLEQNTTYVVTAKKGIQAKNGMVTEKDQSFQFTTGSQKTDPNWTETPSMIQKVEDKSTEAEKLKTPETNITESKTKKVEKLKKEMDNPEVSTFSETSQDTGVEENDRENQKNEKNNAKTRKEADKETKNRICTVVIGIVAVFLLFLAIIIYIIKKRRQE